MRDEARLTVGLGLIHISGGGDIWSIGDQPILTGFSSDTIALTRHLTSGVGVTFTGAWFPGPYVGLTGELIAGRLGSGMRCRTIATSGSQYTHDLCASLENAEFTNTAYSLAGGVVLRPGLRGAVQPFARLTGGLFSAQESFVNTTGFVRDGQELASAAVYRDEHATTISPFVAGGIGFVAGMGPGFQFRVEVRDLWFKLPTVAGATSRQGVTPGTGSAGHHTLSFNVAFDVVLERRRGRRY